MNGLWCNFIRSSSWSITCTSLLIHVLDMLLEGQNHLTIDLWRASCSTSLLGLLISLTNTFKRLFCKKKLKLKTSAALARFHGKENQLNLNRLKSPAHTLEKNTTTSWYEQPYSNSAQAFLLLQVSYVI